MNARKTGRIEPGLETREAFADQMARGTHVKRQIISLRFDPVDALEGYEGDLAAGPDGRLALMTPERIDIAPC